MTAADRTNYRPGRTGKIAYIVVHYTANNGDTAAGNCRYFSAPNRGASAHYFVDESGWQQSVADGDTAWHCGAQRYCHPSCRNGNSIGVELCSRKGANGAYYFCEKTVQNAATLVRQLMERYAIPRTRVLRHYDVTGKNCPAPFVEHPAAWTDFLKRLEEADMTEAQVRSIITASAQEEAEQAPGDWSAEARAWAEENGILRGNGKSMAYNAPCTREQMAVMLYRLWQKMTK